MERQSYTYILARDEEGNDKVITTSEFKPDLASIVRIISKQKSRKFAKSMNFI